MSSELTKVVVPLPTLVVASAELDQVGNDIPLPVLQSLQVNQLGVLLLGDLWKPTQEGILCLGEQLG